jgi:hypothetical protein
MLHYANPGRKLALVGTALCLTACATARMHSVAEINSVGLRCGLALGEVFQDDAEKKLLFVVRPGAEPEQRLCVNRWARENHMKTVFVDNIQFPES